MVVRVLFWPSVAFLLAALGTLVLRAVLLGAVKRWAPRSSVVQAFGDAIRIPSLLWCAVFGLYVASEVALESASLPERVHAHIALLLEAAVIVSVTITGANLLSTLVARAGEWQALGGAVTGLAQTVTRAVVFIVGLLILLSVFGVQITPILTALGVGGLAVALALQDTLANLFAGLHMLADKPIRLGDYVKIGDNVEGYVIDVGWRSTRIRSLANNVLVLPNQTVAKATITNYDLPESRMGIGLKVSVDQAADPKRVVAILLDEVTKAAGEVPGLLGDPAPGVSFIPGFGEYSLDFTVGCQIARFVDQYPVQDELRRRILARLRAEGVTMAVPARVIRVSDGLPTVHDQPPRVGGPENTSPSRREGQGT
jgi:small-conductance mechanosensitive channel